MQIVESIVTLQSQGLKNGRFGQDSSVLELCLFKIVPCSSFACSMPPRLTSTLLRIEFPAIHHLIDFSSGFTIMALRQGEGEGQHKSRKLPEGKQEQNASCKGLGQGREMSGMMWHIVAQYGRFGQDSPVLESWLAPMSVKINK